MLEQFTLRVVHPASRLVIDMQVADPQAVELTLPGVPAVLVDQLDGAAYPLDAEQRLRLVLQPGQAVWFELA